MNNLIFKDFRLSINSFFIIFMPILTGVLFLIPQWPFFLALMYFFFISIPTIFGMFNSQNDFGFSIMMPVSKNDIAKARIISFIIIELLHIITGVIFAFIHVKIYGIFNFMLNLNLAFFGLAFLMFALFNLVFFPLYFRTAYNFGIPTIVGNIVVILFVTAIEFIVLTNNRIAELLEGNTPEMKMVQVGILIAGIALFIILNFVTYKVSAAKFEQIDL